MAIEVALRTGGEIVNYDSVQIYRGFDIGSAKPTRDEQSGVPHHMFDIAEADEHVTAVDWASRAEQVVSDIASRGRLPILVGGTFFYLRALESGLPEMPARDERLRARMRRLMETERGSARLRRLLERIDPVSASRIAAADRNRTERALEVWLLSGRPISSFHRSDSEERLPLLKIAIDVEPAQLREQLDRRVEAMYEQGLVAETEALLSRYPASARPFSSIGYREAVRHLAGELSLDQAKAETRRRTRAYAKRQRTWIRSERGVHHVAGGTVSVTSLDIESLIRTSVKNE